MPTGAPLQSGSVARVFLPGTASHPQTPFAHLPPNLNPTAKVARFRPSRPLSREDREFVKR